LPFTLGDLTVEQAVRQLAGIGVRGVGDGQFADTSGLSNLNTFVTSVAGHIAEEAAR
jgi:hypothetical protein